jgi:hypothetical protein
MPLLTGLPCLNGGSVEPELVSSRTAAIKSLRDKAKAILAAGDEGSLHVVVGHDGLYHCEFFRYQRALNSSAFRHLASVDDWLREWFPKMER